MSVTGTVVGFYDSRYRGWYPLDVELLRVGILGVKKLIDVTVNATVASGSSTTNTVDLWRSENIAVIKKIEISGVPPDNSVSKITITVDGVSSDITSGENIYREPVYGTLIQAVDIENIYGKPVYGTLIQAVITLASAVTADTTLTIRIVGYEVGKPQVPSS